jgi:hypothetical protein
MKEQDSRKKMNPDRDKYIVHALEMTGTLASLTGEGEAGSERETQGSE